MEAGSTAVLRVKRKLGAEPAEALVLACKRLRSSAVELETPKTSPEDLERAAENNIFQLVATVRSQEEPVQPLLRAALRPSQGSQQRIRHHLRASAREIRQEGRYRVVSSHRSSGIPSDSLESEDASGTPKAADDASFQLLDLVHEEDAEVAAAAAISCKKSDPDVILCNCVELIREGLNVSQYGPSSGHQKEQKDDFVYDIYYLERATPRWIENILSVQPYSHEWELVNDDQQPEDIYDDEDDENSENNWRNEYPEEENSDEDSRGSDNYSSVSEEERDNGRPPMWSKYPLDVQKEFDYDSPHDLDSD